MEIGQRLAWNMTCPLFFYFQRVVYFIFFQKLTQNLTLNLSGVNLLGQPEMTEDETDDDDTQAIQDDPMFDDNNNNNNRLNLSGTLQHSSSAPALCFDPVPSTSTPASVKTTASKDVKGFKLKDVTTPLKALTEAAVGTITRSAQKKLDQQKKSKENVAQHD